MLKMYLPHTPSKFIGEAEPIEVKKIKMTCGGGIGGSVWDEYIQSYTFPENLPDGLIKLTNFKGEEITLNTRYMVKITDSQIVGITVESKNHYIGEGLKKYYYETPCDLNIVLCSEYNSRETEKLTFIEKIDL